MYYVELAQFNDMYIIVASISRLSPSFGGQRSRYNYIFAADR